MPMIQDVLSELQAVRGVLGSALVAEDGFVVESQKADNAPEIDFIGGAASAALASARALSQELDKGEVEEVMVEYQEGPLVMVPLAGGYLLVVLLDSVQSLGRARFQIKKSVPQLLEVLA